MNKDPKQITEKKVVILGNSGTGKSTIVKNFVYGMKARSDNKEETIGAERFIKDVEVYINPVLDEKSVQRLQIWDTTGREKFRSISPLYYRDADAFLIVYNLDDLKSFEAIEDYWLPSIQNYGPSNVRVALVGTHNSEVTEDNLYRVIEKEKIIMLVEVNDIQVNHVIQLDQLPLVN